jgi:DNA transformation protein and related proteins
MANSSDFVAFAVELLSSVGPVSARRMFGGHGVYARGVMFALLDDDELFLKVDDETRARFRDAGCRNWVYPAMTEAETSYYRPPDEAHDDPETMAPWAQLGLEAALRAQAAKAKKAVPAAKKARAAEKAPAAKKARTRGNAAPTKKAHAAEKAPKRPARPKATVGGRTRNAGSARKPERKR